ncbi:MAG: hypothetical protein EOP24_36165 [Hyphomicrobiales bacterium]|nr:MAG: hypothetical protein EOP24_36165 [Hyphomicrobiales bacterium]
MSAQAFQAHILDVLGAAPATIEPGRLHRFSTSSRPSDTSGWCKLFGDERGGVFGDWRTSVSETWSLIDKRAMTPAERAAFSRQVALAAQEREVQQQAKYRENAGYVSDLMGSTMPVSRADPVALYLASRGLAGVWNFAPCLRLHPALPYSHEGVRLGTLPAMVAPLQAPDGALVAVHRTYLTDRGRKADVPTVKKLTPAAGPLRGAAIRLQPSRDGVLGVAEGIETALAASMATGIPAWSTYSGAGLAGFVWPRFVRKLVVFGDADDAGRTAASRLQDRARTAGLACSVVYPSIEGQDWADVYAAEVAQ